MRDATSWHGCLGLAVEKTDHQGTDITGYGLVVTVWHMIHVPCTKALVTPGVSLASRSGLSSRQVKDSAAQCTSQLMVAMDLATSKLAATGQPRQHATKVISATVQDRTKTPAPAARPLSV